MGHGQETVKSAEYFFDIDPGVSKGNKIALNANTGTLSQKLLIPTASLKPGFHSVYIRTRDSKDENGKQQWGLYDRASFYKTAFDKANSIAKAEYYFDENDPGVGSATALLVNTNSGSLSQEFTITITNLSKGFHVLNIRTQDDNGKWSLYDRATFYIKEFIANPEIEAIEYFVDSDPGIGLGLRADFTSNDGGQLFDAPIGSFNLANGSHIFYVRVRDSSGKWSIYDSKDFTVNGVLGIKDDVFKIVSVYPNPFQDKINLDSPGMNVIGINVYDMTGKTVYTALKPTAKLDLSHLQSGIYIMNVKTDKGDASYRIIKE